MAMRACGDPSSSTTARAVRPSFLKLLRIDCHGTTGNKNQQKAASPATMTSITTRVTTLARVLCWLAVFPLCSGFGSTRLGATHQVGCSRPAERPSFLALQPLRSLVKPVGQVRVDVRKQSIADNKEDIELEHRKVIQAPHVACCMVGRGMWRCVPRVNRRDITGPLGGTTRACARRFRAAFPGLLALPWLVSALGTSCT